MSRRALILGVALPLALAGHLASAAVAPVGVDIKPGPAALNNPPPRAPQLENTGIWRAAPILVSGSTAYRGGEFLYQDWLYDDRGATTSAGANLARSGRYTYPTDVANYFENAADLVEVRLKLLGTETAFRLTFNSMGNPGLVGTTIALGGVAGTLRAIPFGANAVQPADVFITVHGSTAVATDAASGAVLANLPAAVDVTRRQVEVRLPFAVYNPLGRNAVRVATASGLWDIANARYLIPGTTATPTTPGGAGTLVNPPAFFNVAYRFNEPDASGQSFTRWRDGVQGSTLAALVTVDGVQTHDISSFFSTVDFTKLSAMVDDDSGVIRQGFTNRIYSSSYEVRQGIGNPAAPNLMKSQGCTPTSTVAANGTTSCVPQFAGRLQPYSLYVPVKVPPAAGYGLVTDLHGAGDNYQRNPPVSAERTIDLAERGTGSLVYITEGRGQQYWWWGQAGAEIWEVMADIMRNFPIDKNQIVASGISQGGYGSWKQTTMFPDLYAAVVPHVPCVSAGTGYNGNNAPGGADSFVYPMIDSLRWLPVIGSVGGNDGTCTGDHPYAQGNKAIRDKLDALGYRHEWWSFTGQGHIFGLLACNGISPKPCGQSFQADFLDSVFGVGQPLTKVVDPPHITYSVNQGWNEPLFNVVGDHAYWISGVTVRDASVSPYGRIDVVSRAFGVNDPVPNPTVTTLNTDWNLGQGGNHSYTKWVKTLMAPTAAPQANQIDVTATNVSKVVIDPIRARVDCNARVNVTSDGPIEVVIHGCLAGDVDLNDAVGCGDLTAARGAMGMRTGSARYNARADMDNNGVIDIRDIAAIARLVPAGTVCQ